MPTGYTANVRDGKDTFGQFVWRCARAFGALITMRDDPMDVPVPEKFEVDSHYTDAVDRMERELGRVRAMSDDEAQLEVEKEHKKTIAANDERRARAKQERANYEKMLARVEEWEAPPEHEKLREFMISQLKESIDFDCRDVYQQKVPRLRRDVGRHWRRDRIIELEDGLAAARQRLREEEERVAERNAWIDALRKSVPYEQPE